VTPVTDSIPGHCLNFLALLAAGRRAVDPQIIWKEITTAFEGRAIGGSWAVENGMVRVRNALGEKVTPLEEGNGVWVAWRLLREMAAEGKA
jgi:hypothetical protein